MYAQIAGEKHRGVLKMFPLCTIDEISSVKSTVSLTCFEALQILRIMFSELEG